LQRLGLAGLPVTDPRKEVFPKRLSKTQLAHRYDGQKRYFEPLKRMTCLEELNLTGFFVGDVHATELAAALAVMSQLRSLELSDTGLEFGGAQLIATALAVLPLLESVKMRDVEIGGNGARAIRDAVAGHTQLVELTLTGRNFH
jgi:Ran GTPase-activating protein (RanGAP) involved in mRNA processing and transport